uniref:E3 ubiquitin-protein ligase XIAP n=1 Tax=Neogobius melanostomus TaxID=47308 RepID=A0A8C6TT65_9GOBI
MASTLSGRPLMSCHPSPFGFAGSLTIMSDLEADNFSDFSQLPSRLDSFRGSRLAEQVPAERLARAGFFFTGHADRVQCFSCKKTVENWNREDTPVERHKAVSPTCTFLSCTHRSPLLLNGDYNEAAEDMQYRLRTGEIVDETLYPKVPHMRSEEARLDTFASWPSNSPMRPTDLAQAGLYYMGQNDLVQCFCCAGMMGAWESGDSAWEEHEKHYRNCFFILGHDVGNMPLVGGSQVEEEGSSGRRANNQVHMGSVEERLQSFQGIQHPIDHERLAQAGFYSTGAADRVMCFYCGGGLKGWQPDEDPWEEHAKHYPGCHFLLTEKGQEFINCIQLQSRPTSSQRTGLLEDGSEVLQSSMAQKAIEMGLEPSLVARTITERMRTTGLGYSSVQALVEDCLNNPPDSEASTTAKQDDDPLKKLEKLQREKQCKICMDRDICMVFIPCGHLVCCQRCSAALDKCPICCGTISQKIKTYIS